MIVFDTETEDFLTDLIVQNLDPINEALDLQPSLTFAEYGFKLLFKGLLSSSILDAYSSEVTTRLTLAEHHIYGSNHLGIQYYDQTRTDIASYRDFTNSANDNLGLSIKRPWYSHAYGDIIKSSQKNPWNNWERTVALSSERVLGMKEYALTDHLGNVLVTVLDRKVGHQPVGATQYDYWMADIANAQDFYPYGMLMMNRYTTAGNKFRFGFNGHEKVDEISGSGNHYTAEYWEMDPRLGRRWNPDPVVKFHESPYAILANNPTWFVDPNGADTLDIMKNDDGKWIVSNTQVVKGDDVFRVKVGEETKTYTFSEGEYGERINYLRLESNENETFGLYHLSGTSKTGYGLEPEGPST